MEKYMKYVNGQYVEMTEAELEARREFERQIFYNEMNQPLTEERKLALFISSIPVLEKPADRDGYLWKQMYDANNNCFGWEEVADPFYVPTVDGSYLHPIPFEEGMEVTEGLFYIFEDENIWECVKNGNGATRTKEWFDIIQ